MPVRWLPTSARIFELPEVARLVATLRDAGARRGGGLALERFHETGRFPGDLMEVLTDELAERRHLLDELILRVVHEVGTQASTWAVQAQPHVRVVPPHSAHATTGFHWDAVWGHSPSQWNLWVPLTNITGPEGLWLVDDAVVQPLLANPRLTPEVEAALARAAHPCPVSLGEVLVLRGTTAHGSVPHSLPQTRVSFDVRFTPAGDEPSGILGWRSRRLPSHR